MSRYKVFQPQYYKSFSCTGSKCANNCCHDWDVTIDKDTYDNYMSYENEELRKKLAENIVVTSEEPFGAKFILNESGVCKFQTHKGLCELQLKGGYQSLCQTCQVYPRKFCSVCGELEAYTTMSCEAAAKLALFNTGIMRLEESTIDYKPPIHAVLDLQAYTSSEKGHDTFWRLRNTAIFILQSRKYKMWFRMVLLGFFIKQGDELLSSGKTEELANFTEEFVKRIENGLYDGYAEEIPGKQEIKIGVIYKIMEAVNVKHELFNVCVNQMKEGLGLDTEKRSVQEALDIFNEVCKRYYMPFFKNREYIFENYVVNTVLMSGFPFSYDGKQNMNDNYVRLAVKYSLVKFLLIGMTGYYKQNFKQENVIQGVSAFSRKFDHSKIAEEIVKALENDNAATLGAICIMLKD